MEDEEIYDDVEAPPTKGSRISAMMSNFERPPVTATRPSPVTPAKPLFSKKPVTPPRTADPKNDTKFPGPLVPKRDKPGSKKVFQPPNSPTGAPQMTISTDILKKTKLNEIENKRNSAVRGSKVMIPTAFQKPEENNNSGKPPVLQKPAPAVKPKPREPEQEKQFDFRSRLKPVNKESNKIETSKVEATKSEIPPKSKVSKTEIPAKTEALISPKRENDAEVNGEIQEKAVPAKPRIPERIGKTSPPAIPARKGSERTLPLSPREKEQARDKTALMQTVAPVTENTGKVTPPDDDNKNRKYVRRILPEDPGFPPPKPNTKPKVFKFPPPCKALTAVHTRRLPSIPHDSTVSTPQDKGERQSKRPISLIPTMTDEELEEFDSKTNAEGEFEEEYDDIVIKPDVSSPGPQQPPPRQPSSASPARPPRAAAPPDEVIEEEYDDVENIMKPDDSGSSDSSSLSPSLKNEDNGSRSKTREDKARKENEKKQREEKKREEKALMEKYKKEEKEQKKREKEEKELRAKFKLTGDEVVIQTGTMLETCKGKKLDLAVQEGEAVSIIRLDNNPAGKFLAKNHDGKIGYIDANKIQVDTGGIQLSMKNVKASPPTSREEEVEEIAEDEDFYDEIEFS